MIRIVIVEDDPNKLKQIVDVVRSLEIEVSIVEGRSYRSGLKAIVENAPDLVLLDMSMPTFDVTPKDKGGRTRAFAGRDILDEIVRRKLKVRVAVVTQYETFGEGDDQKTLEQLTVELNEHYQNIFLGIVYYHPAQSDWRSGIQSLIQDQGVGDKSSD